MKQFLFIALLALNTLTYSQKLKDQLNGDWLCIKILDSKSNETQGKFGDSDEFLKFSFSQDNLSFSEAPFDRASLIPIKYGDDFIELFPGAVYELPERIYTVKSLANDSLVLTTKNQNGQPIDYHFVNQSKFIVGIKDSNTIIDNGLIIIKHLKLYRHEYDKRSNRVSEYRVGNNREYLSLRPMFKYENFGHYISINFMFPKTYPPETATDELILDFDVTGSGIENIKIIQGIDDEIDASLCKIIEKTSKMWEPVIINGQIINTTMRFHFIFYLGVMHNYH